MNTEPTSSPLWRTVALFAALALCVFASPLASAQQPAAQTPEPAARQINELVADLQKRAKRLEELQRTIEESPDLASNVITERELSERRARYRRDVAKLVDLVAGGADGAPGVAAGREAATAILNKDARGLFESWEKRAARAIELFEVAERASGPESWKARRELNDEIPRTDRIVGYLDANLEQRKKLGLDIAADEAELMRRIQTRADVIAGVLQNTKEQIDEIAGRPRSDEDTDAQRELSALRRQRDVLADAQRANVRLMQNYGLETAELRRRIITTTGKVSEDILDRDVAKGLFTDWLDGVSDWVRSNAAPLFFQFLVFLLILMAFWVLGRIGRATVRRGLDRSNLDVSTLARNFFIKMTGRLILLLGFIIALAQLGIEVGPLLAGLGIAGFIIGFALQDTLSNFASGMMILVYRPFDIGDAIEAGGVTGKVDKMNLVSTKILTFDNQLLIVPNKEVWGGIIRNVTHQDERRVDMTFGIGYSDDIPKAEKLLADIVTSHDKVLKEPEPVIRLHELGDSSVNFIVRPWAKTGEYWDVYWDVTREVKRRFDEEGISIPFPQRDVHVHQAKDRDDA